MPIYLYKCLACNKEFEYSQRITENALTTCPIEICEQSEKGKGEVERRISKNVGLVFKGSGFYLTDYARKNSSTSTVSKETKKDDTKTEKSAPTIKRDPLSV